ncbi:MAG TPA: adenylyltransferase/cytidyltransferase family protein [Candidatus Limnocylindrales bacterium]|nr:adenylyltransferase/cytidyltransferase family protein [Candidatus Limnocylindrales bacterium]
MHELTRGRNFEPSSRKIILPEDVGQIRKGLKGKKIIVASGVFDFLHPGHVSHLEEAKAQGDLLFVGIASNEIVRAKKGEDRPIQDQEARAKVMAAQGCVDYVVPMSIAPDASFLELITPHVWARGLDHNWEDIDPKTKLVIVTNNISVISTGGDSYRSTEIIEKIKEGR